MQKKVTLSLDEEVYEQFRKHCEENAIMMSKRIELAMNDIMAGKHKTEAESGVPKKIEVKPERIRTWIG